MNIAIIIKSAFFPDEGGVQRVTNNISQIFTNNNHKTIIISYSKRVNNNINIDIPVFNVFNDNQLNMVIKEQNITLLINQAGESLKLNKVLLNIMNSDTLLLNFLHINPLNFYDNNKDFIGFFFSKYNLSFLNNVIVRKLWLGYHILRTRYVFGFIIKNSDAFVMLSDRFKEDLYFLAPSLKKFNYKIHGITNPFESPNVNIKKVIEDKENIILFVGRLHIIQKRVDLLMEIWKKLHENLPDWKFWVVGNGEQKDMMENFCKQNKLDRVKFFGTDVPDEYYKKAKIFHLTSAYEGFGNVLIEAQSYGCVPILFNSYSAAPDIVTDKINGILVDPFNVDRYVNETKALINNSERLNEMALNAYENVSRFSYEKTYEKWDAVFKSMH